MVEVSIHALQQQAQAKGLQIVRKIEAAAPVIGDGDKTTWVLINFLSNAIRYSPEQGNIILSLTEQPGRMIRFSVQDFGPAIDQTFQEKVFEKYYKVPGANESGTGLGLAISKEFIKAMGGSIGVESTPREGAKFWFTHPLADP